MKKVILYLSFVAFLLGGCSKKMDMNTVLKEPHFSGVATEVYDTSMLVSVNEDEEVFGTSDLIIVSLNVEITDSLSDYKAGDEVTVYYDGTIAESYPAQVNKVYAVTIKNRK